MEITVTSKDIQNKYKKLFKYIDTIVYKYYNDKSHRNAFKNISYDYVDLKQEAYIIAVTEISIYKEKYKHKPEFGRGIHLGHHLKKMILYRLKNILRDNLNQNLIVVENLEENPNLNEEIESNQLQKELDRFDTLVNLQKDGFMLGALEKPRTTKEIEGDRNKIIRRHIKLFNPLMIPEKSKEVLLTEKEIIQLIKENSKTKEEFEVIKLKIIENRSYKDIIKILNLPNRTNANLKYQRVIRRLKEKYSNLEELIC